MKLPTLGLLGSAQTRAALFGQVSPCLRLKGDRARISPVLPAFQLQSAAPKAARQFRSRASLVSAFGLMAALGWGCSLPEAPQNPAPSPSSSIIPSGPILPPTLPSPQRSITLKLGDRSFRVRQIQQQLIRRGYLRADYPTGQGDWYGDRYDRYDRETAAAVAKLQEQEADLLPTGEANEATQVMLGLIPVPKPSDGLLWGPVKPGDTSQSVGRLQARLTRLGYFTDRIDGNYGSKTEAAVQNFQLACQCGLEPDGIANQVTRSMMLIRLEQPEGVQQSCQP